MVQKGTSMNFTKLEVVLKKLLSAEAKCSVPSRAHQGKLR